MQPGAILSWEPGLGKTIGGLAWALAKEARRVLVVAPGGLHGQWKEAAWRKFGVHLSDLRSVRDFYGHGLGRGLYVRTDGTNGTDARKGRFFITTYQDLGMNGGDEWPEKCDVEGVKEARELVVKARAVDARWLRVQELVARMTGVPFDVRKLWEGIGEGRGGIRCVWKPTLARVIAAAEVCGGGFDAVIVDEGTRLQSTDSHVGRGVRALNPANRLVLTGTPIKNRLESFFWLAWWACGGSAMPTARWPYEATSEAREQFASQHLQVDRFLTREQEKAGDGGNVSQEMYALLMSSRVKGDELVLSQQLSTKEYARVKQTVEAFGGRWVRARKAHVFPDGARAFLDSLRPIVPVPGGKRNVRMEKRTPRLCNVHRLWKLIAPIVIRRRMADTGESIMPVTMKPIVVPPGKAQQAVYQQHLENPPNQAKKGKGGRGKLNPRVRVGMQLGILRQVALCPDAKALGEVICSGSGPRRSWSDATPKAAAVWALIVECLGRGEQIIVGSPFREFSESLQARLVEAGVASVMLDGKVDQKRRGVMAGEFKLKRYSVMAAGLNAMGEGHSFGGCPNLVRVSASWAFDENEQFDLRVRRLDSEGPVTIYTLVMANSIDERLAKLFEEKGDASEMALDGKLNEETVQPVDLAALLQGAYEDFDAGAATVDEQSIEDQWQREMKGKLGWAERRFREFHPHLAGGVSAGEMADAVAALEVKSPSPLEVAMARAKRKAGMA